MRPLLVLLPLLASLAGCAAPDKPIATCTNLISTGGGLLQFCQTADKLKVSEEGVDTGPEARNVTIVNDPAILGALERDLRLRPELKSSRKVIARACLVNGRKYVSIASTDLKRILAARSGPMPEAATTDAP